jgi:hypothetical protein
MTWPWQKPRIRPGEELVACPDCGTLDPAVSVFLLRNFVRRGREVVAIVTGEQVACRRCPAVYCIGPRGAFKPHPHSYPPSFAIAPEPSSGAPDGPELLRPLPPLPRPRPSI